jgi:hypothetical protein
MNNLEASQRDSAGTKNPSDPLTATDGDSKASHHQIRPARQWYWFGLAIIALVFVAEAALTWRKWSTLTGDVGAELYLPWRLSEGAVLYRDLFFFAGGPFSQYFDALLFKIFGASFLTLAIFNLIAVAAMVLVLFRRFAGAADVWTAAMICLATIVVFTFGYYFYEGFNYVAPYSNEALHGLVLSVFTVAFLSDWISRGRLRSAMLAGFCSGLVFLTKPDIFLALAACDVTAFGILLFLFRKTEFALKSLPAFLVAGITPALFFFFYFLRVENWHDSMRSVVFGWIPMFNATVIKQPFYQWCTGLDHPYPHLKSILFQSALIVIVTACYAAAFRAIRSRNQDWIRIQRRAVPAVAPVLAILIYAYHWRQSGECFSASFMVMLACLWLFLALAVFLLSTVVSGWRPDVYRSPWAIVVMLITPLLTAVYGADWVECGYSLPLVSLACCALVFWNRDALADRKKFVFPFLWSVFGLLMLSKLGIYPRIWQYGFVLAMPAFVAGIYCVFWLLPGLLERRWQVPAFYFRGTVWIVLMAGFCALFYQSTRNFAAQTVAVGSGGDRMVNSDTVEHAKIFNATLAWIQTNVPPNATMAALPQGTIINFLARRVNPTPCVFWDPNIMSVFGQTRMTSAFEQSPPDYILLAERRVGPIDRTYFGSPGYGRDVMQWIKQNYQIQIVIGHEPLKDGQFGIEILKRMSAPATVRRQPLATGHKT